MVIGAGRYPQLHIEKNGCVTFVPIEPVYAWTAPGEPVEVLSGEGSIDGRAVQSARLWAPMNRNVDIRLDAESDRSLRLGCSALKLAHPEFGPVDIAVDISNSGGRGRVLETQLGGADRITRIVVHWINLPAILPGAVLQDESAGLVRRWTTEAGPWRLTVDSRPDLAMTIREMKELDEQFAMTHVGELIAVDGANFDGATASEILFGWQLAMSFALGRWVAPAFPVGFDSKGIRVWEQWAPWRCDQMTGYQSWWDTNTGDDLGLFVRNFVTAYRRPDEQPVVHRLANHAIAANHSGTTNEAKVMLAMAGLEYLGWVDLVLSNVMSRRKFGKLQSKEVLGALLGEAGITAERGMT